jgi:hypothetical protein
MIQILFLLVISFNAAFASSCSPYYNPKKFIKAPEYLKELLVSNSIDFKKRNFSIKQKELYRFTDIDITTDINERFGGFWNDWIGDAYELQLIPEQTLIYYKNYYLSLEVFIKGVVGDGTKLKGTHIKYSFFNYTNEVNKYIKCQEKELLLKY